MQILHRARLIRTNSRSSGKEDGWLIIVKLFGRPALTHRRLAFAHQAVSLWLNHRGAEALLIQAIESSAWPFRCSGNT